MTPKEAADHLGVTTAALSKWRRLGTGPAYSSNLGRCVRYHQDDLDAFMWGRGEGGMVTNTAEARHQRQARAS